MELVNVVGGGALIMNLKSGTLINLQELSKDISEAKTQYDPESYPGLVLNFPHHDATVMLFGSGKFNIAGAKSIDDLISTRDRFIEIISSYIELKGKRVTNFEIRNLVYLHQIDRELDLAAISLALGLESVEYDPEKHPAILYRSPNSSGVVFIYSTGSLILTGVADASEAKQELLSIEEEILGLFEQETT